MFLNFRNISSYLTRTEDEDFLRSKFGESFRTSPKDSPEYYKAKNEYIDYKKTLERKLRGIGIRGFSLDFLNFHTMQSTRHNAKDQVYEMLKQGATKLGFDSDKPHKELANNIKDYILQETGIDISKSGDRVSVILKKFNEEAFLKTKFGESFEVEEKELTGREKAFEKVKSELKKTCEGLVLGSISVSSEERAKIESSLNIPNSRTYKEQVKEVKESSVQYLSMFNKLSPSIFEGRDISFKFRKNGRAFCKVYGESKKASIENVDLTRKDFQQIVLHELTHILDLDQKVLETALCSFVTRVKAGDSSRIYKGKSEHAFNDEFTDKYVGKLYVGQKHTEFMSMGVQNFHDLDVLTHFAINDPHHFATIFATLKGYMK
jgi:hypothetical protein